MKSYRFPAVLSQIAICSMLVVIGATRAEELACDEVHEHAPNWESAAMARLASPPLGLPVVPIPEDNPATIEKIALGRKLFFDRRLSANGTMSCAMCHIPAQGFTNNQLATPIGVAGRSLHRNAPTILNAAYAAHLFHDGRETSLEEQARAPLLAHDEMANPSAGVLVNKIAGLPDYEGWFERAFGCGPSMESIGKAIASWERTLLAGDSPFDRWRYGGVADALTAEQRKGFDLFVGKGRCAACHSVGDTYALFTDQRFHNTGIAYLHRISNQANAPVLVEIAPHVLVAVERTMIDQVSQPRPADWGRFQVTRDPADKWRFKTPSLRNVALTAPYMHDGSFRTLEAVVGFYNRGGAVHDGLDPLIRPLGLDEREVAALVAFLHSLTGRIGSAAEGGAGGVPAGVSRAVDRGPNQGHDDRGGAAARSVTPLTRSLASFVPVATRPTCLGTTSQNMELIFRPFFIPCFLQ